MIRSRSIFRTEPYLVLVIVLNLLLYGRALDYGLVADDLVLVRPLSDFHFGVAGESWNWRPLWHLWMSVQFELWGVNWELFHATSLALHLVNVVLAARILDQLGVDVRVRALGLGSWSILAGNSWSVCWVSESNDLLATFFVLGATLIQFSAWRTSRGQSQRLLSLKAAISCALYFGSLLSKEVAFLWGPLVMTIALLWKRGPARRQIWRNFAFYAPLVPLAAYVAMKVSLQGLGAFSPDGFDSTTSQLRGGSFVVTAAGRLIHYIEGLVYSLFAADLFSSALALLVSLVACCAIVTGAIASNLITRLRSSHVALAAGLWVLAFTVHASITPHPRTLYLASLGTCTLLGMILHATVVPDARHRNARIVIIGAVALALMHVRANQQTVDRLSDFHPVAVQANLQTLRSGKQVSKNAELEAYIQARALGYSGVSRERSMFFDPSPWRVLAKSAFRIVFQKPDSTGPGESNDSGERTANLDDELGLRGCRPELKATTH